MTCLYVIISSLLSWDVGLPGFLWKFVFMFIPLATSLCKQVFRSNKYVVIYTYNHLPASEEPCRNKYTCYKMDVSVSTSGEQLWPFVFLVCTVLLCVIFRERSKIWHQERQIFSQRFHLNWGSLLYRLTSRLSGCLNAVRSLIRVHP